jgi:hypothetical protein
VSWAGHARVRRPASAPSGRAVTTSIADGSERKPAGVSDAPLSSEAGVSGPAPGALATAAKAAVAAAADGWLRQMYRRANPADA